MSQSKTGSGGEIYSNPEADKLSEHYGNDVSYELSKILCEELTKSIDKEILKSLGIEPDRNKRRMNSINKIFKSSV
jgi:hypothetical protein